MNRSKTMALLALLATVSWGCRAIVEIFETDPTASSADAGNNAGDGAASTVDAACGEWSYKPRPFDPCSVAAPDGSLDLDGGDWSYDTNSGALTDPNFDASFPPSVLVQQPDGPEIRVISVDRFTIRQGSTLRVVGARPLVIAAWGDVRISGFIDVGSHENDNDPGAGASPDALCDGGGEGDNGESDSDGSGGGGGGAFAGHGGRGGNGDSGNAIAGAPGAKVPTPTVVRGGCEGGDGGRSGDGVRDHGDGGGALHISSQTVVRVDGWINAGGAGGEGGNGGRSGGGGGGSGGYIGMEAPLVRVDIGARLAANGGGGGGGCDNNDAQDGQDGALEIAGANGGDKEGMGTSGGDGAAGSTADGQAASAATRGGGGGGGGVGYILVRAQDTDIDNLSLVSPMLTPLPWQ